MSESPRSIVYGIRCIENGRIYIGSTIYQDLRWQQHRLALRAGQHHNPHLQSDWYLYGEDKFEFLVLERDVYECGLAEYKWWLVHKTHTYNWMKGRYT